MTPAQTFFADSFDRVFNKLGRDGLCTVFIAEDRVRTLKGDQTSRLDPKKALVLGLYDEHCEPSWLEEDLIWADYNVKGV